MIFIEKKLAKLKKNAILRQNQNYLHMKKLLLIAFCAMSCLCSANAQNEVEASDSSNIAEGQIPVTIDAAGSMFDMVSEYSSFTAGNLTKRKDMTYPLKRGGGLFKKHHIEQAVEICPTISTDKTAKAELISNVDPDDINNTGLGLNFGYSVSFIPCYEDGGKLHMNKPGFAYSLGLVTSITRSDRYGTTCDFLGKIGLETCRNRKLGIGGDFLCGYGKASGDVFWFEDIATDVAPKSSTPYNAWTFKYGGQIWVKTGLLGNSFKSNTDILLFARLVSNKNPDEMEKYSKVHFNLWRTETWSFGVILRYRM